MGARLLIIEDDTELLQQLRKELIPLGYEVDSASDGESGLTKALSDSFDLIIADVKLPMRSGFEICREVRFNRKNVPILILSAQSDVLDKVIGLEIGADDYLVKPFHARELTARIDALLRRAKRVGIQPSQQDEPLRFGDLLIDRPRMKVTRGGEILSLSATEYRVLETLALQPGKVFSRNELRDAVWGYAASSFDHTVTTTLHRLRAKIERDPSHPVFIHSVRGVGYRFVEPKDLESA